MSPRLTTNPRPGAAARAVAFSSSLLKFLRLDAEDSESSERSFSPETLELIGMFTNARESGRLFQ
jgi:hypothetical protein